MACPKFEDLLAGYEGVDAHVAVCPECRLWREALAEVDIALKAGFSDICVSAHFKSRVNARLHTVPITPALLDLAGGMGVAAVLLVLTFRFVPNIEVGVNTVLAISGFSLLGSLALAYRTLSKI